MRRAAVAPQPQQLTHPIAAVVQQHQPDGQRDHQQVELPHPAHGRRFPAAFRYVHLADRKASSGALVTLAAGGRQILRIDGGTRIGRRQNVVHPVATRAIGHRLVALFRRQPVEGSVEEWQLAQLATVSLPSFAASPWKEASKLTTRSEGRLNRRESCTFPWQFPQVSRMLPAYTGEAVLLGARMECSPWQSVQSGACVMPLASACPWTLVRNCPATSLWHIPQVSGTFCRNSADLGRCSSCAAPWHTWQSGAAPLPFFIACPCTERKS